MKNSWSPTTTSVIAITASDTSLSFAEADRGPVQQAVDAEREPRDHECGRGEQCVLEGDPLLEAIEQRVAVAGHEDAVGAPADAEADHLGADDDEGRTGDQRVDVPGASEQAEVREDGELHQRPERDEDEPGTMKRAVGLWTRISRR